MRSSLISAGYFMCEPSLFAMLSPGEPLEDSVLPRLVARGRVHAVVHDGLWLPFDTYKDFIDASLMIEENGFPWLTPA